MLSDDTVLSAETVLTRTALHQRHADLGARFTEFGGWDMPVRYGSIIEEHQAVRTRAGLFDLSHMGELFVRGAEAGQALAAALVSEPGRLQIGRAHYSMICQPDGGVIDDLIVYRLDAEVFLVVPNAGNRAAVFAELSQRLVGFEATIEDATMATSLVAIQGPASAGILGTLTEADLGSLRYYAITTARVADVEARIARTGYTGEDGFELFVAWRDGPAIWQALLEAGASEGVLPCGLGARDTLRLEAGMPLYGNELDRTTTPFEAGLGRAVKLDRDDDFVGRAALVRRAAEPLTRQLVGLMVRGSGIARHGYPVGRPGVEGAIGVVTSGSHSPTLHEAIAMAYVRPQDASPGTMLEVAVRGSTLAVEVVSLPFYRRPH